MSDKNLTELDWKKFSKGRDLKDAVFVKALAALEKARTPDAELAALADIEKQADILRKAGKPDKEITAYFDDLDKALDKQRKLFEMEAKKAAKEHQAKTQEKKGGKDEQEDEEEETPELLTTKMIPLLRQVKKGVEIQVLVARAGSEVAVLMSRRGISPSRRKLLSDYLNGGTAKFFPGHCIFEENAYTFVLKTQAAGLAKKLKAALLKQVELRLKVRVRGEDLNDIDDDGELAEADEILDATDPTAARAVQLKATAAPIVPGAPAASVPSAPLRSDSLKADFDARMAALQPKVLEVLKAQVGDVSKIRAVAEFVHEKGESGQYKAALAGLDSLVKLLDSAGGIPAAPPMGAAVASEVAPAAASSAETSRFNVRLAALLPQVKQAMVTPGASALDIKLKTSEAGVYARKKEFDAAHELLDEVEVLLKNASAATEQSADVTLDNDTAQQDETVQSGDGAAWDRRLAVVERRYLEVLQRKPADASRLRSVMGFAVEQAEEGLIDKASVALDQLEKLLDAAVVTTGAVYSGVIAYRRTLLDLRAAMIRVDGQIERLVLAIPGQMPDESDLAEDLADDLREANEELQDLIDEAMGTAENENTPITRELTKRLDSLIDEVQSNEVIKHVDANPFGVALDIGATLSKALKAVRAALPMPT